MFKMKSVTVDDARQDNVITPVSNRVGQLLWQWKILFDQQGLLHGMHAVCLLEYTRVGERRKLKDEQLRMIIDD